jgi:hypothetical protein
MNTAAIKRIIVLIGIVVGVLLAGLLGTYIIKNLHFSVTGTNPGTKDVSTAAPFFKISFNRTLSKNGLVISTEPDSLIKSYSIDGKVLTINLDYPLQPKRLHTITIRSIQDNGGEKITNKRFTFTPRYIADLPADQTKALLLQQDPNNKRTTDPILAHLPYTTIDFELSADPQPKGEDVARPTLNAILNLSAADMPDQNAAVDKYKQEVADYITSLGFNPANYDIKYIVDTP